VVVTTAPVIHIAATAAESEVVEVASLASIVIGNLAKYITELEPVVEYFMVDD